MRRTMCRCTGPLHYSFLRVSTGRVSGILRQRRSTLKTTAYESDDSPSQQTDNPVPAMNVREQGQAKNLKERILDSDPNAKIIVHAGYAHIYKKPQIEKKGELHWMALPFQELTGIEPLSIDQVDMSEASKPESENADYRFAVDKVLV